MAFSDITRNAVLSAIREFDELGRDRFLHRYGFRKSRGYYIILDGDKYDSKAIVGAAHQFLQPDSQPLRSNSFSGGEATVASLLESLGFEVQRPSDHVFDGNPFVVGATYNRRADIHGPFGGQMRGGISTPSAGIPFVFLFTGESGEQYGYSDGWQSDGSYAYTGEGQEGDMQFLRGNKAIRDHAVNGKELLLFQALKQKGEYRFLGAFSFSHIETRRGPDRNGAEREALIFHLLPISDLAGEPEVVIERTEGKPLSDLRRQAYAAANGGSVSGKPTTKSYYLRSAQVKAYVLARANGICESCEEPAPFIRKNGTPYLEPHHTHRLADGGPDDPRHVAAICPTCHREIHHGLDGKQINDHLKLRISDLEQELDR